MTRARQLLVLCSASAAIIGALVGFFAGVGSLSQHGAARASAPTRPPARGASTGAAAGASQTVLPSTRPSGFRLAAQRRRERVFAAEKPDTPFTRLGEPRPGEWLYSFREPGQSYADYIGARFNRRSARRHTLHLLPFDDLTRGQRALLPILRDYLERFFLGLRVKVMRPARMHASFVDAQRGQVDAHAFASAMAPLVPKDSLGVLGLTNHDLFIPGLNFVFGVGLFHQRAGLHSLRRYGHVPHVLLRRALKLAAHELGHLLTIKHCVFYKCTMNGTNSLDEMDQQPLHACPVDLLKLQHNLGFDVAERYRRLAAFYDKHDLPLDAHFARQRARAARRAGQSR
ncbi:MAG: hypothetical protein KC503_31810 [Myxococcales bacterium]|nr:hypothetical protein [Myxococcales bacterium]